MMKVLFSFSGDLCLNKRLYEHFIYKKQLKAESTLPLLRSCRYSKDSPRNCLDQHNRHGNHNADIKQKTRKLTCQECDFDLGHMLRL